MQLQRSRQFGVLAISHGSRDPDWVRRVRDACAAVQLPDGLTECPFVCSFLELVDGHLIQDGIDELEACGVTDLFVIPLFVSAGSQHMAEIAWALGLKDHPGFVTDLPPYRVHANVHACRPMEDDPEIASLLAGKLRAISRDPARELALIVAHGSKEATFVAHWEQSLRSLAVQLQQVGGFAAADHALLLPDQVAAKMTEWQMRHPELTVLVAPLFMSEGYFTRTVIPQRLQGYAYKYSGEALLPSHYISRWMERTLADRYKSMISEG